MFYIPRNVTTDKREDGGLNTHNPCRKNTYKTIWGIFFRSAILIFVYILDIDLVHLKGTGNIVYITKTTDLSYFVATKFIV